MNRTISLLPYLPLLAAMLSGAFGIIGVIAGAYLSRRSGKHNWLLEAKRTEWRELISTLTHAQECWSEALQDSEYEYVVVVTAEQEQMARQSIVDARRVMQDRVVIAERLIEENLLERWQLLLAIGDSRQFLSGWRVLHQDLIRVANRDLGIGSKRQYRTYFRLYRRNAMSLPSKATSAFSTKAAS